jgi:hypothetical protein
MVNLLYNLTKGIFVQNINVCSYIQFHPNKLFFLMYMNKCVINGLLTKRKSLLCQTKEKVIYQKKFFFSSMGHHFFSKKPRIFQWDITHFQRISLFSNGISLFSKDITFNKKVDITFGFFDFFQKSRTNAKNNFQRDYFLTRMTRVDEFQKKIHFPMGHHFFSKDITFFQWDITFFKGYHFLTKKWISLLVSLTFFKNPEPMQKFFSKRRVLSHDTRVLLTFNGIEEKSLKKPFILQCRL